MLARLARVDVLIRDDWGMAPLSPAERRDMSELMEDRYGEHSTILVRPLSHARAHQTTPGAGIWASMQAMQVGDEARAERELADASS